MTLPRQLFFKIQPMQLEQIPMVLDWYQGAWIRFAFQGASAQDFHFMLSGTSQHLNFVGEIAGKCVTHASVYLITPDIAYIGGLITGDGYKTFDWALQALSEHFNYFLEQFPEIERFEIMFQDGNIVSLKAAKLVGAKPAVIRRSAMWFRGQYMDLMHFSFSREDMMSIADRAQHLADRIRGPR